MKKSISLILVVSLFFSTILCVSGAGSFIEVDATEIWLEAESVEGAVLVDDSDASGNKAVKLASGQSLSFTIPIVTAGAYKIFVRTKGTDSFSYSLNSPESTSIFFDYSETEYTWMLLEAQTLKAGNNTLEITRRWKNIYVDRILVTDSNNFMPIDKGQAFSSGNNGFSSAYPAPGYFPTDVGHPRVIVNSDTLPALRESLKAESLEDAYDKVYRNTNASLPVIDCNVEWRDTHSPWLDYIEANAFFYLIETDKTTSTAKGYAQNAVEKTVDYLTALLREIPTSVLQEQRRIGGAIFIASIVYDWCYGSDALTAEKQNTIIDMIMTLASSQECGWPPIGLSAFDNNHGWEYSIVKDLFAFVIAVYDERPDIYNLVAGRIFSEFVPVANYHAESSGFMYRSSDDYSMTRFECELYMAILLKGMGCNLIDPRQKNIAYQAILRVRPDGERFRSGDMSTGSGSQNKVRTHTLLLPALYLYKDGYFKAKVDELENPQYLTNDATNQSVMFYLLFNDCTVKPKDVTNLPLTVYSGNEQGTVTARTGWGTDDLAVSLRLPEQYFRGHQHLDSGSFEAYYKGALLLDSGLYDSFGSGHHDNYYARTIAHNCMLVYQDGETDFGMGTVNDGGQKMQYQFDHSVTTDTYPDEAAERTVGKVLGFDYGDDPNEPSYTYFSGDLDGWYSADKLSDYQRSFLFLNFFDDVRPGALIVFDRVVSSNANYKKTFLLHSQKEPTIAGTTTTITNGKYGASEQGKVVNQTLLPENPSITVVSKDEQPAKYYLSDSYSAYQPDTDKYDLNYDESGTYRIEISPSAASTTDYFLNVMQFSDSDVEEALATTRYDDNDFCGVQIQNKAVFFYKGVSKKDTSFEVKTDGEGYLDYLIAGVAAGEWAVTCGDITQTVTVQENTGLLKFSGFAGKVSAVPVSVGAEQKILDFYASKPGSPELDTVLTAYRTENSATAFVREVKENEFTIGEKGFLFSGNPMAEIGDAKNSWQLKVLEDTRNAFGICVLDPKYYYPASYYLRPYVKFTGAVAGEQVAYGDAVYVEQDEGTAVSLALSEISNQVISLNQGVDTANSATFEDRIFDSIEDNKIGVAMANSEAGTKNKTSIGLLQFSLDSLTDVAFEHPVQLELYGCLDNGFGTETPQGGTATVYLYAVPNTVWNSLTNNAAKVTALTDISSIIGTEKPIASLDIPVTKSSGALANHVFDITEYLKTVYNKGENDVTLAVYVKIPNRDDAASYYKFRYWYANSKLNYYNYEK